MSEWISIDDRLPPIGVFLLFLDGEKTMGNHAPFHHIDKINERGEALINYCHNYSHWMPLPEPPME